MAGDALSPAGSRTARSQAGLSIVVPVFNEVNNLSTCTRVKKAGVARTARAYKLEPIEARVASQSQAGAQRQYLVLDASVPGTALAAKHASLRYVRASWCVGFGGCTEARRSLSVRQLSGRGKPQRE
jgi:hypothetical protein